MRVRDIKRPFIAVVIAAITAMALVLTVACAAKSSTTAKSTSPTTTSASQPTSTAKTTTSESPKATPSPTATESAWDKVVAAAKKEGELNLYGTAFAGDYQAAILKDFGQKYGIKLNFVGGDSTVLIQRIQTENQVKKYVADVVQVDTNGATILLKDNLIDEFASKLPAWTQSKPSDWRVTPFFWDGKLFLDYLVYCLPLINEKLVPPGSEPKSWYDLLDPKWNGKIVMASPTLNATPYRFYITADRLGIKDRDDYFRKLGQNKPFVLSGHPASADAVAKGDYAIDFTNYDTHAGRTRGAGAPTKLVYMKEGAIALQSGNFNLVKNAPHPNAALLYLNWVVSKEGMASGVGSRKATPVRSDLPSYVVPGSVPTDVTKTVAFTLEDSDVMAQLKTSGTLEKLMGLPVSK